MDAERKHLRDEVAELSEAVRALRDELAVTRAVQHCHGCHCVHPAWIYPGSPGLPYWPVYTTITSSVTTGGTAGLLEVTGAD